MMRRQGGRRMLTQADNDLLTRVGLGTGMGAPASIV
jgi:hypothetical protein